MKVRDLHDIEVALSRLDAARRDLSLGKPDDIIGARMTLSAAIEDLRAVRDRYREAAPQSPRGRAASAWLHANSRS